MQTADTKEIIIKKTFHLLLQKGYDGVSISDIQKATGMSRGLLYHYFGNKEALFVEAAQFYFTDLFGVEQSVINDYNVEEMIDYIVEKYSRIYTVDWDIQENEPTLGIMNYDFLFYRVMQENDDFSTKCLSARNKELQGWKQVLENTRKKGLLRDNIDLKKVAKDFVYLMDGVWMNAVNKNESVHLITDLKETLIHFWELLKKEN